MASPSVMTSEKEAALNTWEVMDGPKCSAGWAPTSAQVPEDPVGPTGYGKVRGNAIQTHHYPCHARVVLLISPELLRVSRLRQAV